MLAQRWCAAATRRPLLPPRGMLLPLLLLLLSSGAGGWKIDWGVGNKTFCDEHCVNSTVCSTYIGWRLKFGARGPVDDPAVQCKFLTGLQSNERFYNSSDLTDYLGDRGVMIVAGDSIMRHMFVELVAFLGNDPYAAWWRQLQHDSLQWRGLGRDKLEHTFLCSPPLGPRNLTLAFLWRPFFGDHLTSVPFTPPTDPTRCKWSANDGVHSCDHAMPDGALERWPCRDTLDSVQLPGQPPRRFVVLASAGGHTAVEELHAAKDLNLSATLASSAGRFKAGWDKLEAAKQHWASITRQGGRNIFLTTARLSYGAPRTVMSNHASADRMDAMLEVHIREPLRAGRSNLTCGDDGLEIIDTTPIFYAPNSPGSSGDGMHHEQITNTALIQQIVHRLVHYNASNWRQDGASWNATTLTPACV